MEELDAPKRMGPHTEEDEHAPLLQMAGRALCVLHPCQDRQFREDVAVNHLQPEGR